MCPECGAEARSERALFKSHRRWREAVAALVLGLIGWGVGHMPAVQQDGWAAAVPVRVLIVVVPLFDERAEEAFTAAINQPSIAAATKSPRWSRLLFLHGWVRRMERDPAMVRYGISVLSPGAPENALVTPMLVKLLDHEDEQVCRWAHSVLSSMGWLYPQFEPAYTRWLRHPSPTVRCAAMAAIGAAGNAAESLIPALRDAADGDQVKDGEAIAVVQSILGYPADSHPGEPGRDADLRRLLTDDRWQVREAAADALAWLDDRSIIGHQPVAPNPELVEVLWDRMAEEHPAVRRAMVRAIATKSWTHPGWEAQAERMILLMEADPDPGVRRTCLSMVRLLESRYYGEPLAAREKRPRTLRAASIGMRDEDLSLRQEARGLLGALEGP